MNQEKRNGNNIEKLGEKMKEIEEVLNNNSWATYNLFKRSMKKKKYTDAFLYFLYFFELNLKHMITSEMFVRNLKKQLKELKESGDIFSPYSETEIMKILRIGFMSEPIKIFCELHGNKIKDDLENINKERNFIIHNMIKKKLEERKIENSFKEFFIKTNSNIKFCLLFFDGILEQRPYDFIDELKRVIEKKNS